MKKKVKKKKSTHVYADLETARTKPIKYCATCGEGFHGRPYVCPGCYPTELSLRKQYRL